MFLGEEGGGGGGTRTPDTGIMIPLLYQLSYTATGAIGCDGRRAKLWGCASLVKRAAGARHAWRRRANRGPDAARVAAAGQGSRLTTRLSNSTSHWPAPPVYADSAMPPEGR